MGQSSGSVHEVLVLCGKRHKLVPSVVVREKCTLAMLKLRVFRHGMLGYVEYMSTNYPPHHVGNISRSD